MAITTYELNLIETALMQILQGDYWSATIGEAKTFTNDLRKSIHNRSMIAPQDEANTVITYPPVMAMQQKLPAFGVARLNKLRAQEAAEAAAEADLPPGADQ
jgi:hypothetical protein